MSRSNYSKFKDRLATLRRRRNFLWQRINEYQGKDNSRDKAEHAALSWAIDVIESYPEAALSRIELEGKQNE